MPRGGKRAGAGRPATGAKQVASFTLSDEAQARLTEIAQQQGISKSAAVESAVNKQWRESRMKAEIFKSDGGRYFIEWIQPPDSDAGMDLRFERLISPEEGWDIGAFEWEYRGSADLLYSKEYTKGSAVAGYDFSVVFTNWEQFPELHKHVVFACDALRKEQRNREYLIAMG